MPQPTPRETPTSAEHPVVFIPGDGIGPEVMACAREVLDASGVAIEWLPMSIGHAEYAEDGNPVPEAVVASIRSVGAALKGPVETPANAGYRSANVSLRRELDLYAQLRPSRHRPGVASRSPGIDLIVIREPTEGLYRGIEFDRGAPATLELLDWLGRGGDEIDRDSGLSISPLSARAARRVFEFAFSYARRNQRRRVTAVHKATVMRSTDGLFLETGREVARHNPDVDFDDLLIDRLALELVLRPDQFDVLVMQNLYGDIVSDLAAGITGGLGFAAGANYGDAAAVFEPAHGNVRHRVGTDTANPIGAILSGAMLLRHLGELEAAARVERAVDAALASGDANGTAATRAGVLKFLSS
jgi:isocitrate dehydrogenase (NAD+)